MSYLPETNFTKKLLEEGLIEKSQVEGNFIYETLSWRVREKDVKMSIEQKYIASLITLTGNLLLPNCILKSMASLVGFSGFKRKFGQIVLSERVAKLLLYQNAFVNIMRSEGYRPAFKKVLAKLVGYRWAIQRTDMKSKMKLAFDFSAFRRKLTGL